MELDDLKRQAERVRRTHVELEEAQSELDRAHQLLLEQFLDATRPALDAICSPMPTGTHAGLGILIFHGHGENVYWLDDGTLAILLPDGSFSPCTVASLVDIGGASVVIDATMRISLAIDAQSRGKKGKSTEKIYRQAEQLRALAVIIRGLA